MAKSTDLIFHRLRLRGTFWYTAHVLTAACLCLTLLLLLVLVLVAVACPCCCCLYLLLLLLNSLCLLLLLVFAAVVEDVLFCEVYGPKSGEDINYYGIA